MSKSTRLFFSIAVAVVTASGCQKSDRARTSGSLSPEATSDPKRPVARVGTETITDAELQTAIKGRVGRLEAEHAEKVHGLKSDALNEMIETRLIAAKAKTEGITPEKLVEREVTSKIPEPPAAQVQQVYDQTKAGGRPLPPFEQVKPEIVKFLKEQGSAAARKTFIDKLRTDAKVETLLPPLLLPKVEVAAEGPTQGEANAPVTIIEFSDYECGFCGRAEESVKRVLADYKGKVRLVYRDFPLPFHSKAPKASEAALCAGDQGKYWEMHTKLFANQQALDVPQLKEHAKGLGLEPGKFDKCLDSGEKTKAIEASKKAGDEAGVTGTPAFFINGRPLTGAQPYEKFKEVIDYELANKGS